MKYLLFAGHNYYPQGGVDDLKARAETVDELKCYFVAHATDIANGSYIDIWCQIVEIETMRCVLCGAIAHAKGNLCVPGEASWHQCEDIDG